MEAKEAKDAMGNSPEIGDRVVVAISTSISNAILALGTIKDLICTKKQVKADVVMDTNRSGLNVPWHLNVIFSPISTKIIIINKCDRLNNTSKELN